VQLQPARARRRGEARHPARGRHADGVRHRLRLRRCGHGHRRDEGVAHLARPHRRLHRARRSGAQLRRHRLPHRLRQDEPGRRDGPRSPEHSRAHPLQRHDPSRVLQRKRRHRAERLRGGRCVSRREDQRRRALGAGERRLSGARRMRRPVHREHDEHGDGGARPLPRWAERHPRTGPRQDRGRRTGRRDRRATRAR